MRLHLNSSAPHIHPAAEWHQAVPDADALVLYKSTVTAVEVGIRRWQQGTCEFFCDRDMLCYFQLGRGVFRRATGESIDAAPETTAHFKQGWHGVLEVFEPLDATFMTCDGGPSLITPVLLMN